MVCYIIAFRVSSLDWFTYSSRRDEPYDYYDRAVFFISLVPLYIYLACLLSLAWVIPMVDVRLLLYHSTSFSQYIFSFSSFHFHANTRDHNRASSYLRKT